MLLKHFWNSLCFELVDMVILKKNIPRALFMINFLTPSPLTSLFNHLNSEITHQFKVTSMVTFYCKIKKEKWRMFFRRKDEFVATSSES